jgi:hypothetical protein
MSQYTTRHHSIHQQAQTIYVQGISWEELIKMHFTAETYQQILKGKGTLKIPTQLLLIFEWVDDDVDDGEGVRALQHLRNEVVHSYTVIDATHVEHHMEAEVYAEYLQ